jgi:type II secretory pathway pseudopilin PulG
MPGGKSFFKKTSGFTLIEMLLVVGLFVLLGFVIIDVFLLSLNAQRQASHRQTTLNSLRFVTETLARQIRTSTIDYNQPYTRDGDAGIQGDEEELFLIGDDGLTYHYFTSLNTLFVEVNGTCQPNLICSLGGGACSVLGEDCGFQAAPMVSRNDLEVDAALFRITPAINPFLQEQCSQHTDCTLYIPGVGEPAAGCSICPPGGCPVNEERVGFCRCEADAHCAVTQRCDTELNLCVPHDIHPFVTLSLTFSSDATNPDDQKTLQLQTTVASRIYQR